MTEADLKKHLDTAEKSPKQIAAAVSGLPDETLRYKPSPNKWCILEILAHLADIEILYAYRMRQMLADRDPVIAPIDQDAWAKNLGYMESSPPELTCTLRAEPTRECAVASAAEGGRFEKVGPPPRT